MISSSRCILVLRLTVSLLCAVINGIDLSFNVYAVILKETFNFTQTQVEITASMSCIGFGLTFLEPLTTGFFGYNATFALCWVLLTMSCGLYAFAAKHTTYFHYCPPLIYLVQLGLSTGSAVAYMVVSRICLHIVPREHTGTYIGVFGSAICFGKILFAGLFEVFFHNNLFGFFVSLCIMFGVFMTLCYVLLYPVTKTLQSIPSSEPDTKAQGSTEKDCFKDMLCSSYFHMMFWTTGLFSSVGYTILNNITSITDSIKLADSFTIITLMSICIMCTRLLYGLLYDRLSSKTWGFCLLFSTYISIAVGLLIGMFALSKTTVYILTVLSGIGTGPALFLPLAMMVAEFGRPTYSPVSAGLYAIVAVTELFEQVIMGFLYDRKSMQLGRVDHFCYGTDCFFWALSLLLLITLLSLLIQFINFVRSTPQPVVV